MGPLDGLHVEVESSLFRVGADGGVARVGERAGLPVAETGHVILISAEVSLFGCPGRPLEKKVHRRAKGRERLT